MNKILQIFALVLIVNLGYSQDESLYKLYQTNESIINPAATGFYDTHKFNFNFRSSMTGFDATPQSLAISYNGAVGKSIGLGAVISSETLGEISRTDVQLNYAFRQKLSNMTIGAGVSTKFQMTQVPNSIFDRYGSDYVDITGDDVLQSYLDGRGEFDASFGLFARHNLGTYGGISFQNLVQGRVESINSNENTSILSNFNIYAGHEFKVAEGFSVEPSILIGNGLYTPMFYDVNIKVKFLEEKIITGLSYRGGREGELGILLGTKFNAVSAYYTYDLYFGEFQRYNSGSHEFTLGFEFDSRSKNSIEKL